MPSCCKANPAAAKIHRTHIKRRTAGPLDSRGQKPATDATVTTSLVPAGIEELMGRELEHARQQVGTATHRVTITLDPAWELSVRDWLDFTKVSGRKLKLNIGHIRNTDGLDREFELLCAEDV